MNAQRSKSPEQLGKNGDPLSTDCVVAAFAVHEGKAIWLGKFAKSGNRLY